MSIFALLGYPLSHSFSRAYFTEKWEAMGLSDTHRYLNVEVAELDDFLAAVSRRSVGGLPQVEASSGLEVPKPPNEGEVQPLTEKPTDLRKSEQKEQTALPLVDWSDLRGLNVTIPYKQAIIPYLDSLDPAAAEIGAVNTIRIDAAGRWTGFNTDVVGFETDLSKLLQQQRPPKALVLGTGGAAQAVHYVLKKLGVDATAVSRRAGHDRLRYDQLRELDLDDFRLIVNTTPLGTFPNVDTAPDLPYERLSDKHFCYDLVYNPAETLFLRRAADRGARTCNGLGMLIGQAEAAWKIWTNEEGKRPGQ